jgi:hypothetical protein
VIVYVKDKDVSLYDLASLWRNQIYYAHELIINRVTEWYFSHSISCYSIYYDILWKERSRVENWYSVRALM